MGAQARHQVRLFFVALQFFTRLPVPRRVGFSPDWPQQALRYFPAVGLVVALLAGAVYVAALLALPQPVALLLSMIAGIFLTGALHEDGFADVCDGFGGGRNGARVLEIMHDSRIGAYGAIGIALMLGLKFLTLAQMSAQQGLLALLLAHPLSRLAAASLIWRLNYVRPAGKAQPLAQHMTHAGFGIAALSVLLIMLALGLAGALSWGGMALAVVAVSVATLWLARFFVARIGGFTGDCLGAVQQVAEVVVYLTLLAVA